MNKHLLQIIIAALLLFNTFIYAEIRETTSMQEIVPLVDDSTLLVVDIDNTLIEPEGNLGSDQWYYFLVRKYVQLDHMSGKAANETAMQVWNQAQWLVKIRPVEKDTPALIKQLQSKGVRVMGLTARTVDIVDKTFAQLKSIGISLNQPPIHDKPVDFHLDDLARFENGILFVGEQNDKGEALVQFLRRSHYLPAKIIFIDDKLRHVENVEKALSKTGARFLGFRYGAADEKVRLFNQDTQDIALFAGGILPSAVTPKADAAKER